MCMMLICKSPENMSASDIFQGLRAAAAVRDFAHMAVCSRKRVL